MSHVSDPYYQWLGIPPEDQPANHYRLLGLPLFESHREVIQHASDQRMAYLKALATGRDSDVSERLLNEVSAATVCLLNSSKKKAYDAQLRSQLPLSAGVMRGEAPPPVSRSASIRRPSPTSVNDLESPEQPAPRIRANMASVRSRVQRRKRDRRKKQSLLTLTIQLLVTGVIGLAAGCFVLWLANPDHPIIKYVESMVRSPERSSKHNALSGQGVTQKPNEVQSDKTQPDGEQPDTTQVLEKQEVLKGDHSGQEGLDSRPAEPVISEPTYRQPSPLQTVPIPKAQQQHATGISTNKTITLVLSKQLAYVTLPEVTDIRKTRIEVEEITGLASPYQLSPIDGVIRHQQPVDVVFTLHERAKIRLSLEKVGTTVRLEACPLIEGERRQVVSFRNSWVKRTDNSLEITAAKWEQQVISAETDIRAIQTWLQSPVTKPLAMRGARRTRLTYLQGEIGVWRQAAMQARRESQNFKRYVELANEIHKRTRIQFAVWLAHQELSRVDGPVSADETISREGEARASSTLNAGRTSLNDRGPYEKVVTHDVPGDEQRRGHSTHPAPASDSGPGSAVVQLHSESSDLVAEVCNCLHQRDLLGARNRWMRAHVPDDKRKAETDQACLLLLHCYECFWEGVSQSLDDRPAPRELQVGPASYILLTRFNVGGEVLSIRKDGVQLDYLVRAHRLPALGELQATELVVVSEMPATWLDAIFKDHSYPDPGLHELYEAAFFMGEGRNDLAEHLLREAQHGALDTETGLWISEAASVLQATVVLRNVNRP